MRRLVWLVPFALAGCSTAPVAGLLDVTHPSPGRIPQDRPAADLPAAGGSSLPPPPAGRPAVPIFDPAKRRKPDPSEPTAPVEPTPRPRPREAPPAPEPDLPPPREESSIPPPPPPPDT